MTPSPKVIFITAYDDGGKTKARLLKMGAYACLDKPVSSLKELEETVNKAASN
jgi:CheY-like chemotaxis protein